MGRLDKVMIVGLVWLVLTIAWLVLVLTGVVHARDLGQWENQDPAISQWFRDLQQPDNAPASCCGAADAYWCDDVHVRDGHVFCKITDDRDDIPLRRMHVPVGTEIAIPDSKLTQKGGNPTGHALVFLSTSQYVYCFVDNGGS